MSTDERRQWQMDFILDQQAQFTTDMHQLKELHAQAEKRTDRLERVVKLMIRAGRRERREWRERYTALVDSQIQTEEITRRNSEAIARTNEAVERASESVARSNEAIERTNESVTRSNEATARNTESIARNSIAINQLAEIVRQLAVKGNGNGA